MTHIIAGYPNIATSESLMLEMDRVGVSYGEIQIPFSDPIADGPTIMSANQEALNNGITPDDCFDLMKRLHERVSMPLLFMSYYNILHHYGVDRFCQKARRAGAYGLIVPDVPYDEEPYEHYLEICKKYELKAIQVVSPITPDERLKKIAEIADGFVYCVAHTGTTGSRDENNTSLRDYLINVRKTIDLPLAVGFGISEKSQVEVVLRHADIAVIGSKVISFVNEGKTIKWIGEWLQEIIEG